MTRVLHVGKYYPPVEGGIENHVHSLVTGLASRYEITALVFNTRAQTSQETLGGVRVVRVATWGRILSTEMAPSFFSWFLKLRHADIVHLHTPNPIGELACLALPRTARLIITYHSDVVRQKLLGRLNRLVLHRLMRRAERIVAFTKRYMETSPVLQRYAEKCAIIPHGVDLDEMEATPEIRLRAEELKKIHGPRLALFVGRLVYYKGIDTLLRALVQVPDAKLAIVGDGPMRGPLEELARGLGVASRVVFLGRVSHLEKVAWYLAADFLVLPATHRSEAFGLVQVEAMACGLPVISTNIDSGVPFVNRDQETGIIVEPSDPDGLAAAMSRLLDDAALRARYGAAGRARVERLFCRDVMLRDSVLLYEEVLGAPTAKRP
ncbi:MAG TPA: glycosyltransferase [Candidatus Polarisedimenticolia bacterium]|nr:glycosyltransferase [Candidatus Polarisedimenticolia bacterium]